ncbi:hypothetical protein Lal_00028041 [Lupinus albus]|nr:hypothetical protein Lal_00028041 [Lupinus albus]
MTRRVNFIEEINATKDTWKIKVRIIGLWRVDRSSAPSLEMIFMDENGDKIEAVVKNYHISLWEPQLQEGQSYVGENFDVSNSIKYLFKYIHKGYDRVTATIIPTENESSSQVQNIDEIKQYLDCTYMSPCETCWRIFSFSIHGRSPAVERLYFHLENEQSIIFDDSDVIDDILSKPTVKYSMFTSWMEANKQYVGVKDLTYAQFVSKFVYINHNRCWKPRKQGYTIGRLIWVPPSIGELFYLRMMLNSIKGPCNYEDIRTVNNVIYPTFRETCFAMGFLEDDREYIEAIKEADEWGSGYYLRKLFVTMLTSNSINRPKHVWQQTWKLLVDGILYEQRRLSNMQNLQLTDQQLQNLTLLEIENLLQINRKSIRDYPSMPYPEGRITSQLGNRLIYAERDYDKEELKAEFIHCFNLLTDEQMIIFDKIMKVVNDGNGGTFFLYGYDGTGKTFIWKTLASTLRSENHIFLTVASSGIASLLLSGGRTAHSKLAIPVPTFENSTCNIHQGSELAELLKQTKLIIWDEAPMTHKYCFEALDKTLTDIMSFRGKRNSTFGGKVIVFCGDFRQILPVIPRGSRSNIINATINSSYIWDNFQVLTLTRNMRLQSTINNTNHLQIQQFAKWILDVGDGKLSEPNDGYALIEIP